MILVTGGTGLIGSHLLLDLLRKNYSIRAIKRASSNLQHVKKVFGYYTTESESLFEKIEWVDVDLLDSSSIEENLGGIDKVYHCAAIVSFQPKEQKKLIKNNIEVTRSIVNACLKYPNIELCHVSSIAALGNSINDELITEEHRWNPNDKHYSYSISKYYSELEVWRGIEEGLKAVIVLPSFILGPGNWDSSSTIIIKSIYKGLKYYTTGVVGYVDVRDVSKSMIQLMEKKCFGEKFLVTTENYNFKEMFTEIAEQLHVPAPSKTINYKTARIACILEKIRTFLFNSKPLVTKESVEAAFHVTQYSNEKIKKELDFDFIPIKETIQHTTTIFISEHE